MLLGEVHDHPGQHALRLQAFEALLARGARPALLLEPFDRQHQPALDARRAAPPPPDADALIAIAGTGGWEWRFYRPFVELALRHDLPIVAVNVGRAEAQRVMREGLAAHGFDADVPPALLDAHAALIGTSHCDQLDTATARRMALAQIARDQSMARALEAHADRGAVLLAGNVHVRTDIGAPVWLDAATRAQRIDRLRRGRRRQRGLRPPHRHRPAPPPRPLRAAHAGALSTPPAASISQFAVRSSRASSPWRPTSCSPSGMPSAPRSSGSPTAGNPAKLASVHITGSPVLASPSGAVPSADGVAQASSPWTSNQRSKPARSACAASVPRRQRTAPTCSPRSIWPCNGVDRRAAPSRHSDSNEPAISASITTRWCS